jgi:hypothetical protein
MVFLDAEAVLKLPSNPIRPPQARFNMNLFLTSEGELVIVWGNPQDITAVGLARAQRLLTWAMTRL